MLLRDLRERWVGSAVATTEATSRWPSRLLFIATGLLVIGVVAAARGDGSPTAGSSAHGALAVTWTMVDVTGDGQQGDAHLIEAGRTRFLIDAGTYELAQQRLVPHLARQRVSHVDIAFLTHVHRDHIGGLRALIDAGISIGQVELSLPDQDVCLREAGWGCDHNEITELISLLEHARIPFREPPPGETWALADVGMVTLLERLDGDTPEVGVIDVNDTSLILRLDAYDTSVLFTGDLNQPLGARLATEDLGLRRRVLLKVPHHGAESLAPNSFFEAVQPDVALVPAPRGVWCGERSARARTWLADRNIPVHVSGLAGNVTVTIGRSVSVTTEKPAASCALAGS